MRTVTSALIRLPASLDASAIAREELRKLLISWERDEDPAAVALLVTELVTNAVCYSGGPVDLTVTVRRDRLRCAVRDTSHARPIVRDIDVEREDGRGLEIVAALAAAWGVCEEPDGKTVWLELTGPHASTPG